MGILKLPGNTDYWRKSKRMFKTAFNDIMTKDRFNIIWRYLHLNDRQAPLAVPDKLIKVWWCGFFFLFLLKYSIKTKKMRKKVTKTIKVYFQVYLWSVHLGHPSVKSEKQKKENMWVHSNSCNSGYNKCISIIFLPVCRIWNSLHFIHVYYGVKLDRNRRKFHLKS